VSLSVSIGSVDSCRAVRAEAKPGGIAQKEGAADLLLQCLSGSYSSVSYLAQVKEERGGTSPAYEDVRSFREGLLLRFS